MAMVRGIGQILTYILLLALALSPVCDSKFAQHEAAEELTPDTFKSKVLDGKEVLLFS